MSIPEAVGLGVAMLAVVGLMALYLIARVVIDRRYRKEFGHAGAEQKDRGEDSHLG